jgi:hypothetical protein
MEGVTDVTLAALAEDIARDDAADADARAAKAAARKHTHTHTHAAPKAKTPRASAAAAAAAAFFADDADDAAADADADAAAAAADGDESQSSSSDDGDGDADVALDPPRASSSSDGASAPPGHARGRSGSLMLELLLDLDLAGGAHLPQEGPPAAGGATCDADAACSDDGSDDWVSICAPMGGGTLGVLAPGGPGPSALPPQLHGGAEEDEALARPSLRMLRTQGDAGAAGAGAAQEDLICLNSPQK